MAGGPGGRAAAAPGQRRQRAAGGQGCARGASLRSPCAGDAPPHGWLVAAQSSRSGRRRGRCHCRRTVARRARRSRRRRPRRRRQRPRRSSSSRWRRAAPLRKVRAVSLALGCLHVAHRQGRLTTRPAAGNLGFTLGRAAEEPQAGKDAQRAPQARPQAQARPRAHALLRCQAAPARAHEHVSLPQAPVGESKAADAGPGGAHAADAAAARADAGFAGLPLPLVRPQEQLHLLQTCAKCAPLPRVPTGGLLLAPALSACRRARAVARSRRPRTARGPRCRCACAACRAARRRATATPRPSWPSWTTRRCLRSWTASRCSSRSTTSPARCSRRVQGPRPCATPHPARRGAQGCPARAVPGGARAQAAVVALPQAALRLVPGTLWDCAPRPCPVWSALSFFLCWHPLTVARRAATRGAQERQRRLRAGHVRVL